MIFLLEYNRPEGKLITFREFDATDRQKAHDAQLELELDLHRKGISHEIVLLEASNAEALRESHGRYFKTISQIASELENSMQ